MSSRDIHSRSGGVAVRDLLSSFFSVLLLRSTTGRPIYLISPWLSDFILFDNTIRQYRDLFVHQVALADNEFVLFSDVLAEISAHSQIRIITWPDKTSLRFVKRVQNKSNISIKFEDEKRDHQKGLLCDMFYFEGSMNFTYSGVYRNGEKITCNSSNYRDGVDKINEAYLEFDRIWNNLYT